MSNWDKKALITNLKAEYTSLNQLLERMGNEAPSEVLGYLREMANQSFELMTEVVKSEEGSLPMTVAIVGDFNAGKSSFINHILKDQICPENVKPTTSVVTTFVHGLKERITVESSSQKPREVSRAEYEHLVQEQPADSALNENIRFTFSLPNNALRGLKLLDTPGFNNPKNINDGIVTESVMAESDAFFYLVDVNKGEIPKTEIKTLEKLKSEAPDSPIFLVISKADIKSPPALQRITNTLQTKYGNLFNVQILSYSTQDDRNDINTRADIIARLADLREHATAKNRASLVRAIKHHYDNRLTKGAEVEAFLGIQVNDRNKQGHLRSERLEKIIARCYEFGELASEQFCKEFEDAFRSTVVAEEVLGTDYCFFFWKVKKNEVRIVYNRDELINRIKCFEVFKSIEKEKKKALRSLFGKDYQLPDRFYINRVDCASSADQWISNNSWDDKHFGTAEEARESLKNYYDALFDALVEEAWRPLIDTLEKIEKYIRREYHKQTATIQNDATELSHAVTALSKVYEKGVKLF